MTNFLLPQLNTEQPNYARSFMQGFQMPYAFQQMQTRQTLLNEELEKSRAFKKYATTGDINALKRVPETYLHFKKEERETESATTKMQEAKLNVVKELVPHLLTNPDPNLANQMAGMVYEKLKLPPGSIPFFKTPEEVTAYATKLQDAMLSPKERLALQPKAPEIKEMYDPETGLKRKMQYNSATRQWEPFGGQAAETEREKGKYARLMEFHKNIRPGIEPTEESLQDLFDKFDSRGLNLNNNVDYQATKQASISLSRNVEFNILDPSNPADAAKREKMLIDETKRLKRGMTGSIGKKVIPPSYPATIQKADGVYTKTGQVDPATGKPIYKAPNGELVLPK